MTDILTTHNMNDLTSPPQTSQYESPL